MDTTDVRPAGAITVQAAADLPEPVRLRLFEQMSQLAVRVGVDVELRVIPAA